jgi:hypothetical protein
MDDVFSTMLVVAISAVSLVAGQQYLYKKPEISAATFVSLPNVAVDRLSSYER